MNKILGQSGEDTAAEMLVGLGYEVVTRNYRTRFGEIDIIARDGATWVFVEVKARTSDSFGTAKEAVNKKKLQKLQLIIRDCIATYHLVGPIRCEVVAIQGQGEPELVEAIDFSDLGA